jgi:outer membrane receptor protein involved in Fe transport
MKQIFQFFIFILPVIIMFVSPLWSGTTGKIAGIIIDRETGDPLPGANVVIVQTALGSASDMQGQYTILYVPPGIYDLEVAYIGYKKVTITDVRVQIDQTTRVNVELEVEAIEGETVTIVADRDLLRDDVATSVVALTNRDVEELPVSNVSNVVGLQAGIRNNLEIRGGGSNEALILMDGITLRDPRNNNPISSLALSAIKEISIERGGFNAEYGQVRSGIVNVVTQEGSKSAYHGNIEFKYSPPAPKHFGISPFDKNSFWLRPYYDEAVCWTGTKGEPFEDVNSSQFWDEGEPYTDVNGDGNWTGWDRYTQRQYWDFEGWNAVSERLMSDDDPDNDLSPVGAQRLFMWETRKEPLLDQPDYNIDAGFGGPVPFIGSNLGNLRFFTSFRRYREMLVVPLSRDDYVDYDWTLKLTTDITPSMKLVISGLTGKKFTMQQNWSYSYLRYPNTIASIMEDRPGLLFGTGNFSLADISHKNLSAKLTHTVSSQTFYEVSLEHFRRDYFTRPPAKRDQTKKYEIIPGYFVDEAPFGYDPANEVGITGMLFGGHVCKRRDNTKVSSTTLKMDVTSQVNFSNMVKTGMEIVYNNLDFDYGIITSNYENQYDERVQMRFFPWRAALYLQDKLETKGFIMNAGLRLDYSNSNTEWWNPVEYDPLFFGSKYSTDLIFPMIRSGAQWQLSPRLGISHPITNNSKLFFNYGHFKQMPSYETLFRVGRSFNQRMTKFGDPDLVLAKTISYELGFDYTLSSDFLLQIAGFYRDISNQQDSIRFTSISGLIYDRTTSESYEDIRGVEFSIRKSGGKWWNFFANYTYQVNTSGHFGSQNAYEDPSEQKKYDEATVNLYQERPIPRPYARANVSFYTPDEYGPDYLGIYPLGGYMLNLIVNWQAGQWVTWNPKNIATIENNVKESDYFDALLRLSKTFQFNRFKVQVFVDVDNLFNYKRMSLSNFTGKEGDRDEYFYSLHLPESEAYDNIPGDDRVGSYRKTGVEYQPMEWRGMIEYENEADRGNSGVIYYDRSTGRYVEYIKNTGDTENPGDWIDIDKKRLNKILEDKAYIDMPNYDSFSFFNPRQIYFGVRVSFNLR